MPASVIDLNDLDLFAHGDPYQAWRQLRADNPVYWNPVGESGFWALTRYRDVYAAYADPVTFSSRYGTVLGGSYRSDSDTASGKMLIASDDPQHRLLRKQVHPAFLPDLLDKAVVTVRDYLSAALDRFIAAGGGDFAAEIAPELPAGLLATMFGLGREDAVYLLGQTRAMIGFQDPRYHGTMPPPATLVAAQVAIMEMMSDLMRVRRRVPGDDLVSILLGATINGRGMSRGEILYNCLNVAVGGNETTPFTASAAVQAFIEHPGQHERLLDDPSLLPAAFEEICRWTSTNAYVQRRATRPVEIAGVGIAAGDSVTLWNASANRDETQFPNPDRFDVARTPNRHITFGVGGHRCIGMSVAKLEISALLEEIVGRGLRFAPAGQPKRLRSNFMLGLTSLPVTVTAG